MANLVRMILPLVKVVPTVWLAGDVQVKSKVPNFSME